MSQPSDVSVVARAERVIEWLRANAPASADLRLDSRELEAGDIFVACPGRSGDGRQHVDAALARGAAAVLAEAQGAQAMTPPRPGVPVLAVSDLRAVLGAVADAWYGHPSRALTVIAVTGTNGKTSCVDWLASALSNGGQPCGTIGTLGARLPDGTLVPGMLTTPDVLAMHRLLAAMRGAGAQAVALEASSIGLEQGRLDGVHIGVAAFTNLSRDHLDYHPDMASYEAAKARLFHRPGLTRAVINVDDPAGRRLLAALPRDVVMSYGIDTPADVQALGLGTTAHGQVFTLTMARREAQIMTALVGRHNVSNLLLVAGVLRTLGWSLGDIARELVAAGPVDGRMQTVRPLAPADEAAQAPLVVVDYAHTPDALQRALEALRPVARARGGRLWCVFGCGGGRDPGKRPLMGGVAAAGADHSVITSDNPRGEDCNAIIAQIVAGVPASRSPDGVVTVEPDRARAIMQTIWRAAEADVVLLAGKGHETYQEINGVRHIFDDRHWARLALLLPLVPGVSTDTRSIRAGELFVALSGDNFDGHAYLAQAEQAGACAAVVAHPVAGSTLPQLVLGDTRVALGRMAAAWRRRFDIPLIGVTGSNGKTTTKEMIAAILADWLGADHRLATAGNFNNEIGVPLTLLRLRPQHRAAVIELGMNHPGEIAELAALAAPTIGLVNNAQREHQEFMETVQAVALENGAVLQRLPAEGCAVYPGDDVHTATWDALAGAGHIVRFGEQPGLDVFAHAVIERPQGMACQLTTPAGTVPLQLAVPGRHNLRNALAATACALAAGAPLASVCRALATFDGVAGRMRKLQRGDGTWVVDDTYNANPDSVRAAIDVLAALPAPRALVLGDMAEVGAEGPAMHREVGAYANDRGIEVLFTLGEAARDSARAFGAQARASASVEEIVAALRALRPQSVLVKGSRFMRMERVVKAFMNEGGQGPQAEGGQHAA